MQHPMNPIPHIKKLPDELINQIKAGEVVERPYNVVKELVENSIDASAENIHVEILDGGKQLIRITDDGTGICKEDLPLALERHATSKIRQFSDLHKITSFGFRGEALPSMASVSSFSIKSKPENQELGLEIHVDGGKITSQKDVVIKRGTTISVRDLFFNVPARLKFLKSTSTEFSHINDFLFATSLCNPNISFRFTHNGRDVFFHQKKPSLHPHFTEILGLESQNYAPIDFKRGSFHIKGYALLPQHAKSSSSHFVMFLNGRYVKDRIIRAGVLQAYEGLLLKGLVPSAFVFIQVDPTLVDINAHPSKIEVRFYDPLSIQELISIGIQESLKEQINRSLQTSMPIITPRSSDEVIRHAPIAQSFYSKPDNENSKSTQYQPRSFISNNRFLHVSKLKSDENSFAAPAPSKVLFEEKKSSPFDQAKYLGQFLNCYLILEVNSELWLLDQHAFHERILFEELTCLHKENKIQKQPLLTPLILELNSECFSHACDYQDKIASLGFETEILKNHQIAIHSHPSFLPIGKIAPVLEEMLSQLTINDDAFHLVFATMACHSAVRSGDPLNAELALRLLQRAENVDFYAHCPHGRPVIRKFSQRDVESWFQRI